MTPVIERVRLSGAAKQQLTTLKRRTGLEHYNVICRHALCASLANPTTAPQETLQYGGGLEIEWRTFAGEADLTLTNLLVTRAINEGSEPTSAVVRDLLHRHLHRGLAYLLSDPNRLCQANLALSSVS